MDCTAVQHTETSRAVRTTACGHKLFDGLVVLVFFFSWLRGSAGNIYHPSVIFHFSSIINEALVGTIQLSELREDSLVPIYLGCGMSTAGQETV